MRQMKNPLEGLSREEVREQCRRGLPIWDHLSWRQKYALAGPERSPEQVKELLKAELRGSVDRDVVTEPFAITGGTVMHAFAQQATHWTTVLGDDLPPVVPLDAARMQQPWGEDYMFTLAFPKRPNLGREYVQAKLFLPLLAGARPDVPGDLLTELMLDAVRTYGRTRINQLESSLGDRRPTLKLRRGESPSLSLMPLLPTLAGAPDVWLTLSKRF